MSWVKTLLVRRSMLGGLDLVTALPVMISMWLVSWIAERWRVTISCAVADLRTACTMMVRAVPLRVSAVLLRNRTVGLLVKVVVTTTCRCRLLSRVVFVLLIGAVRFRGSVVTLLVRLDCLMTLVMIWLGRRWGL